MKPRQLHDWKVSIEEAKSVQRLLASQVSQEGEVKDPRFIAGVDISAGGRKGIARGAVVVLSYPELDLVEVESAEQPLDFPYVPGLLSFREAPLVLSAWEKLKTIPDLLLVDGQGIAHPRRMGLASHLGLLLDVPSIGCAKSILCGQHQPVEDARGSRAELVDKGEVVGAAVRSKKGSAPLYVSVGHRICLSSAVSWTLRCCRGHRLPEPTRLAHLAAGGHLRIEASPQASLRLQEKLL